MSGMQEAEGDPRRSRATSAQDNSRLPHCLCDNSALGLPLHQAGAVTAALNWLRVTETTRLH